ncbi:cation-translocating P-type ATPase [Micromonospora yangpuensis]|uniref:ATPase, P-type (Transporting), HAD superfamily, subfamily IC n=1 Tax=Micromonospora yangpuensis TaxID=683228 RepID=A0A1C6TWQ1_9ACTN|nr:cation-translocating P-type ATPase [Micromonospora yangpuensis]GGM01470.1 haloacid dehalogenase [Micromonospora yangpuensis]SCL46205.1 ATPase, P-type (transporting), HAD superfamily, subfamily IC [Micromonospora yangpuensis]
MTSLGRLVGLLRPLAVAPPLPVPTRLPELPGVPRVVDGASRTAGAAAARLARAAGLTRRRVWSADGRHHIEVHGVCQDGGDRLARQVEAALARLPGVRWARVNAPSGRVVVAVDQPGPRLRELIATIDRTERHCDHDPDPEVPPPHPPEEGPRTARTLGALVSDALGLTISAATRILPLTPVPGEVSGLLTAIDLHPRLHELASRGLRADPRAEVLFPLAEAVVQGLTGGWAGIVLDGAQRVVQWGEARAQLHAWEQAEPGLTGTPDRAVARAPRCDRPRPRPDGPAERYVKQALAAGTVAGAAALPTLGAKRAAALALSSLPKAPGSGREGYAAQLGALLARRGVIAMDRSVLRELDRIDTVLVDAAVLGSDRGSLADLAPLSGVETGQVAARAFELFDPATPDGLHRADGWRLGPLDELAATDPGDTAHSRQLRSDGTRLLGLARGDRLAALLRVEPEPAPGVEALPTAARQAGLRLVVAADSVGNENTASTAGTNGTADSVGTNGSVGSPGTNGRARYGFADAVLPGGPRLAESVRQLQRDGAVVLVVSGDRAALAAADCGLGVAGPDELPPWGAHLLIGTDLRLAALIVGAVGVARRMTGQNIRLAMAGTGLGALGAFTAATGQLPGRALAAVNGAGALAFAHGVWRAHQLPGPADTPTAPTTAWHLMPVSTALRRLGTDRAGLSEAEAARRRTRDTAAQAGPAGLLRAFVDELNNPLTPVLAAGAILSASFGSLVDAALVGGVVGGTAVVGAVHRQRTERSLAELLSRSAVTARVCRDGAEREVSADELVDGDVIVLAPGDAVPADCRVLESVGLEIDESSLTGESLPVGKTDQPVVASVVAERRSMVYEGTTVAAGHGCALVVATGTDTEAGRSLALARQGAPSGGVEARLGKLTSKSVPLALASAVAVAGAGLARRVPLAETASTAANLAVASVPEGLPFMVSAAQLAAARRLAEHGALVRNPRTIEALGRVDVLCFDKTGTLTEGRLLLSGVGDGDRYAPTDQLDPHLRTVLATALRATPAADDPEELPEQTDRAVRRGAGRAEVTEQTGAAAWKPVGNLPFEPSRGYHATTGSGDGGVLLSVKGAPETVLPRCTARRTPSGVVPLDQAGRDRIHRELNRHASSGQRVLAVAERSVDAGHLDDSDVRELTFVGLLALADGVRASAAPAVANIRRAGVHTIMITGDHPATAAAIAKVISPGAGPRVVTATDLDALDDEAVANRLADTDVVARCTPTHKVRIIQALRSHGRTVAMTGDGANDAAAIRLADVGIALGQHGTPAARAAADLVVTDDRLETIIATLAEGRAMWSSVRHGLSILVGGNLGEIAFSIVSAAATGRSALNGRQLLLVNMLTDLAPALAIAVRPPNPKHSEDLLREGPDTSLGRTLDREIALRATATALGATAGWTLARWTGTRRRAGTVGLVSLVGTQLGQTVLAGGTSPGVLLATAASVGVLVVVVQTPGLSQFFGCTPLGPVGWSIATGSAVGATMANGALTRLVERLPQPPGAAGTPG